MAPRLRHLFDRDQASTTVELALIAPLLILLIFGILDVARAFNAYLVVGNAAREGARYAIVHPKAELSSIEDAVRSRSLPLRTGDLEVVASYCQTSPCDATSFQQWGPPPGPRRPAAVRVEVRYPWDASSSIVGVYLGTVGGPRWLTSASTMDVRP